MFNQKSFFKNTYCEFVFVNFNINEFKTYVSKSGSVYHYTQQGVYRYSNHWGRVANCHWKLKGVTNYKNQDWYVGYANWNNFYDLHSSLKQCFLHVDFEKEEVNIELSNSNEYFAFSIQEALRRKKEITSVFKDDKWLVYKNGDKTSLKKEMIHLLITTNESFQKLKLEL